MTDVRERYRPAVGVLVAGLVAALVAGPVTGASAQDSTFTGTVDNDSSTAAPRSVVHPVTVTGAGQVTATLDWADPAANLTLILKKPDGTQAAVAATGNRPERVAFDAPAAGTYKLNVIAAAGGSAYTLAAAYPGADGPPPPVDGDPSATTFSGTVDNDASSPAGKTAIHPFSVSSPGSVTATLDWAGVADLTLILKKPDGTQAAFAGTSNNPERITYSATTTGTYKLNVIAKTGGSAYTLTATSGGDGTTPPPTTGAPAYVRTIGGVGHPEMAPSGLDVDDAGNVYVADTANDRVTMYNPVGVRQWEQGKRGTRANGNFSNPRDVAYADGKVYVGDTGYNRVQVLDAATGRWLATWSARFGALLGISAGVDANKARIVLVSDSTSQTVKTYTPAGVLLKTVGKGLGTADGYFNQVRDAATGADGTIYAADFKNQRVQVFTPTGDFKFKFGTGCPKPNEIDRDPLCAPGQFKEPYGVALDEAGNVYVSDNKRVQKFTAAGTNPVEYGSPGTGDTQFFQLRRVAVGAGPSPYVYGADLWGYKILKFSQSRVLLQTYGNVKPAPGKFNQPYGLSVSGDTVYVADTNNHRIQEFSTATGAFRETWGHRGFGKDDLNGMNWPRGVSYNPGTNTVWVADTKNYRATEHLLNGDPTGRIFGTTGAVLQPGVLNWVYGITSYGSDVIVADTFGNKITRWTGDSATTPVWTYTGVKSPKGVKVVGNELYVADSINHRIVILDARTGALLRTMGETVLHRVEGVVATADGHVWAADTSHNRLVEFDPTGKVVRTFGKIGSGPDQFNAPAHLALGTGADSDLLYVMDSNNDRVQVFNIG